VQNQCPATAETSYDSQRLDHRPEARPEAAAHRRASLNPSPGAGANESQCEAWRLPNVTSRGRDCMHSLPKSWGRRSAQSPAARGSSDPRGVSGSWGFQLSVVRCPREQRHNPVYPAGVSSKRRSRPPRRVRGVEQKDASPRAKDATTDRRAGKPCMAKNHVWLQEPASCEINQSRQGFELRANISHGHPRVKLILRARRPAKYRETYRPIHILADRARLSPNRRTRRATSSRQVGGSHALPWGMFVGASCGQVKS
jgi:hypothetical protein